MPLCYSILKILNLDGVSVIDKLVLKLMLCIPKNSIFLNEIGNSMPKKAFY